MMQFKIQGAVHGYKNKDFLGIKAPGQLLFV